MVFFAKENFKAYFFASAPKVVFSRRCRIPTFKDLLFFQVSATFLLIQSLFWRQRASPSLRGQKVGKGAGKTDLLLSEVGEGKVET